jgi:hypothetical protein
MFLEEMKPIDRDSNDALAVDWLHFFQEHTRNRAGGGQRLLLFDGHGSIEQQ